MWLQQRLKGLPSLLSSSWARRVLIGLLLFLIFYWYLSSDGMFRFLTGSGRSGGAAGVCLQTETARWQPLVDRGEGVVFSPQSKTAAPAVVGNGHFLVDIDSNKLWVSSSSQAGSPPVHLTEYSPAVTLEMQEKHSEAQASVLWFRKGSVLSVRCIIPGARQSSRDCVTVREEFIAHRSRPNVYIQRVHVTNPLDWVATFDVTSPSPSFGNKFSTSLEKADDKDFILSTGRVLAENNHFVLVVVASKKIPSRLQVAPKSEYMENMVSVVHVSEPVESSKIEETFSKLRDGAKKEIVDLLRANVEDVIKDHLQAWTDLFISGNLVISSLGKA